MVLLGLGFLKIICNSRLPPRKKSEMNLKVSSLWDPQVHLLEEKLESQKEQN